MKIFLTDAAHALAAERLASIVPGAAITTPGALAVEGLDVALFSSDLYREARDSDAARAAIVAVATSPTVRWVQSAGAGVDHPLFGMLLARGVALTNAPGIHSRPIAEYVFAQVLAQTRRVRDHDALQARREYTALSQDELTGKTMGIVGYGGIGRDLARIARAFGMSVLGLRRTPGPDDLATEMLPPSALHDLLSRSDVIVLAVPLSDATRALVGAAELAVMRPDAILVNVARGEVLDESALVAALTRGHLRAAILDVQSEEPLPPSSPLWSLDRCVVTPHDSASSPLTLPRVVDLFLDNLARFVRQETLLHRVTAT